VALLELLDAAVVGVGFDLFEGGARLGDQLLALLLLFAEGGHVHDSKEKGRLEGGRSVRWRAARLSLGWLPGMTWQAAEPLLGIGLAAKPALPVVKFALLGSRARSSERRPTVVSG
jgi:hypothetical protein